MLTIEQLSSSLLGRSILDQVNFQFRLVLPLRGGNDSQRTIALIEQHPYDMN